ncbi:MAG: translesion error-prone DNA polymerase V autoproteolytic subunit [Spirochaetes bacterium]|nr:translesion error-prone DNA polymerase V autoproteolytic subunit [Spirochaetota bacterium]
MIHRCRIETVWRFACTSSRGFPLFLAAIPAGFPSPADDYVDRHLDLNELLIRHPAATFFVRVVGDSMIGAGIHSGDILVVDRALPAEHNRVVIAALNGELTVKRLWKKNGKIYLVAENGDFEPIEVTREMQFEIWGVVIHVIHSL